MGVKSWGAIDEGLYSMFMSKVEYIDKLSHEIASYPSIYAIDNEYLMPESVKRACSALGLRYDELDFSDIKTILNKAAKELN